MKLNIKGLVFVGFAAAVFASAAQADATTDAKTVTSKTYVDNKYVAGTGVTIEDGTQADGTLGKKVISIDGNLTPYAEGANIDFSDPDPQTGVVTISGDYDTFTRATAQSDGNGLVPGPAQSDDGTSYLRSDGSWAGTFTPGTAQAAGDDGLVPGPAQNDNGHKFLRSDGTWAGTFGTTDGADGLVPAASTSGDTDKFLKGDGTWGTPANTTYTFATGDTAGDFKYSTNGGQSYTEVAIKDAEVTTHMVKSTSATNGTGITISATDTQYPSAKAVYDFMMNGWSASNCTDANPCALVVGTNGVPTWQAIAQPGD